jgi:hypothetical protein
MRTAILSAACSLLLLFCSDSGLAQSSPTRAEAPQPQVFVGHEPLTAGLFERQKAEPGGIQIHGEATNHPANPQQSWLNLFRQQNGSAAAGDLRAELAEPMNEGILPQIEPGVCAHIVIFQAPETDSEMVINVPPGTGGDITTFKGLGPCCRDIHPSMTQPKLPGLRLFPRRPPLLQPPFVVRPPSDHDPADQPTKEGAPAEKH